MVLKILDDDNWSLSPAVLSVSLSTRCGQASGSDGGEVSRYGG